MILQSVINSLKDKEIQIKQSGKLLELRLTGFDNLVGIIDENEKIYYMPTADHMRHRLEQLPADKFKQIMELYIKAGEVLKENGYYRRHISDYWFLYAPLSNIAHNSY